MRESKLMSAQEALEFIKAAKDVYDWNQRRHLIKFNINPAVLPAFLLLVDTTGLIRTVAKDNNWPKVYRYSYGWGNEGIKEETNG